MLLSSQFYYKPNLRLNQHSNAVFVLYTVAMAGTRIVNDHAAIFFSDLQPFHSYYTTTRLNYSGYRLKSTYVLSICLNITS